MCAGNGNGVWGQMLLKSTQLYSTFTRFDESTLWKYFKCQFWEKLNTVETPIKLSDFLIFEWGHHLNKDSRNKSICVENCFHPNPKNTEIIQLNFRSYEKMRKILLQNSSQIFSFFLEKVIVIRKYPIYIFYIKFFT